MNALSDPPLFSLPACPSRLTNDWIKQFQENGYLAFSDVLSPDEVQASRQALSDITRDLTRDPAVEYAGPRAATSKSNQGGARYARAPLAMHLEPGYDPVGHSAAEIELKVRKYWSFSGEAAVFQTMLAPGSRLRAVVEGLIGADPILFQEMALVKPPFIGSEKPWHQDNAYFSVTPLDAILGVWIALDDAGVENGCMHVIPGAHREGAVTHHHGTDCEIDPGLLDVSRAVAVPVPAGGAMFFYGMLPHETPPNRSPERRRALQFHFRGAQSRIVDEEAYDREFINREGIPASCRSASRLGF
ncbi:MAG: phytanoyl-CoA dioxygenase family protein, partial [Terrimicrobiaceae bacterium]